MKAVTYQGKQKVVVKTVPFGNYNPFVIPEECELEDEYLLFLSDVLPTAYWSVEHANVKEGDTVIVLGSGPIGIMAQKFAWLKGAERVIAVTARNRLFQFFMYKKKETGINDK